MKTNSIKLLLILLIFNLSSCKEESAAPFTNYMFSDKPQVITCENTDSKLLNEALYAFENDIASFYNKQQPNVDRAYNTFTRQVTGNKPEYNKIATKHSLEIASALKNAGYIKDAGVNYNNPIVSCISEKMTQNGLQTTFNALVSTNSMSKKVFNPALQRSAHTVSRDKYLAIYVALEYYYSEILKIDIESVTNPAVKTDNTKVDFNKRPARQ